MELVVNVPPQVTTHQVYRPGDFFLTASNRIYFLCMENAGIALRYLGTMERVAFIPKSMPPFLVSHEELTEHIRSFKLITKAEFRVIHVEGQ